MESYECELKGSILTLKSILKETLFVDIDSTEVEEAWKIWEQNIDAFINKGALECAKTLMHNAALHANQNV